MHDEQSALRDAIGSLYRLEREVGRGGMATVYLAHDLKHDRRVALKVLLPELAAAVGRERFLREIQITARLQHPHILPVLDSGESAGMLWYAMPFVDGASLRTRMDHEGQFAIEAALDIARDIASALDAAHARRIIHRDIKPENILLQDGHAVVADFGIARALDGVVDERLTRTGMGLGTPRYMSPEQSLGERVVDGRTDVYALASLVYEMLAGEPPYDGPTAQAIIAKRLSQTAPSVRVLRETVSEGVDAAITKALAKAPADRFATAGEFVAALSAPPPPPRTGGRVTPSRTRAAIVAAALVLVVALGSTWAMLRSSPATNPAARVIAVMPFASASGDTALSRLGRDLAGTVSATIDGIGDIRVVDRLTVLAQVPASRGRPLPLADASSLARRLGASSVAYGSITRDGARVRLDVNLVTTDSLVEIARGTVFAAPDNLTALTDSVVWKLLAGVWRRGRSPTPTLDAVTTRSVEALRSYLDGEHDLIAGNGEAAKEAFGHAIDADSTFWFAYYRKANSMGWSESQVDSATEAGYRNHADRLPVREQLLIAATRSDSGFAKQRAQLETITRRFPEYWPAWWMLADNLLHYYPEQLGTDLNDARIALERVTELNPVMIYAWGHLAEVYRAIGDTARLAGALDTLRRLNARPMFVKNERFDRLQWNEALLSLLRGHSATSLLDTLYANAIKPNGDRWMISNFLNLNGFPAQQIVLNQRYARLAWPRDDMRAVWEGMGSAWMTRGMWDSALVVRDHYDPAARDSSWTMMTYRFAVIGTWLDAIPVSEVARRRADFVRFGVPRGPGYVAELAWLDGVLAAAARDTAALAAAQRALQQSGGAWVGFLARSLGAFAASLRGDKRGAATMMSALEREMGDDASLDYATRQSPHLILRGIDRLAGAEWSLAARDTAQAVRLLNWQLAFSNPNTDKSALGPLVYLLRARIKDAQRNVEGARSDYQAFLDRFDTPSPSLRHLVTEARTAVTRLDHAANEPAELRKP